MSVAGSVPTTSTRYSVSSSASRTLIWSASSITWLLVRISPDAVMKKPEPEDRWTRGCCRSLPSSRGPKKKWNGSLGICCRRSEGS